MSFEDYEKKKERKHLLLLICREKELMGKCIGYVKGFSNFYKEKQRQNHI